MARGGGGLSDRSVFPPFSSRSAFKMSALGAIYGENVRTRPLSQSEGGDILGGEKGKKERCGGRRVREGFVVLTRSHFPISFGAA